MILNSLFYHVIAFRYKGDYEALLEKIPEFWEPAPLITGENDVYSHVAAFIEPAAKGTVLPEEARPLGSSYGFNRDKAGEWGRLLFREHDLVWKDQAAVWKMEKAGLVLFRGGLGFFWFCPRYLAMYSKTAEDTVPAEDAGDTGDSAPAGDAASAGTAPAAGDTVYRRIFCEEVPIDEKNILDANNTLKEIFYSRTKKRRKYYLCRKQDDPREANPGEFRVFRDMFFPMVSSWCEVETFFADRENSSGDIFPDKSRLFSYMHLEEEAPKHRTLLVCLARGYSGRYSPFSGLRDNDLNGIYRPFDNSLWYAAQEGAANLTTGPADSFYASGNYRKRLETYFFIYILILMQYYGMLSHAARIGGLPSTAKELMKRENMRKIQEYLEEENIFYLKNMFSQVSHITQHNEFYSYAQARMQIPEMEKELREELDSMDHMLNRKAEREREGKLSLFTLLGFLFVTVELISNVFQVVAQDVGNLPLVVGQTTAGCLAVIAIGIVIWALYGKIRKWWERKH